MTNSINSTTEPPTNSTKWIISALLHSGIMINSPLIDSWRRLDSIEPPGLCKTVFKHRIFSLHVAMISVWKHKIWFGISGRLTMNFSLFSLNELQISTKWLIRTFSVQTRFQIYLHSLPNAKDVCEFWVLAYFLNRVGSGWTQYPDVSHVQHHCCLLMTMKLSPFDRWT